jgi:hypothetical protein
MRFYWWPFNHASSRNDHKRLATTLLQALGRFTLEKNVIRGHSRLSSFPALGALRRVMRGNGCKLSRTTQMRSATGHRMVHVTGTLVLRTQAQRFSARTGL